LVTVGHCGVEEEDALGCDRGGAAAVPSLAFAGSQHDERSSVKKKNSLL